MADLIFTTVVSNSLPVQISVVNGPTLVAAVSAGTPGKSAYELWLEAGNIGTVQEFLDSLKGTGVPETGNANDFIMRNGDGLAWVAVGFSTVRDLVDKHYNHYQMVASATWVITHNLNKYPAVRTFNGYQEEVIGEIVYNSLNQVTIIFNSPFSGRAFLN